jgi:hypothetical protein
MAGDALFIGWGTVVRGREQLSLQVFGEAIEYYGKLQQEGRIERFEPFLLEFHGGDLNGFIVMYGERAKLDEVRADAEFVRLAARANAVVENLGIVNALTGEALGARMQLFGEVSQEVPQAR